MVAIESQHGQDQIITRSSFIFEKKRINRLSIESRCIVKTLKSSVRTSLDCKLSLLQFVELTTHYHSPDYNSAAKKPPAKKMESKITETDDSPRYNISSTIERGWNRHYRSSGLFWFSIETTAVL